MSMKIAITMTTETRSCVAGRVRFFLVMFIWCCRFCASIPYQEGGKERQQRKYNEKRRQISFGTQVNLLFDDYCCLFFCFIVERVQFPAR